MSTFRQRLKEGRPLVGTLLTMGVPIVAEMLSRCGFDWLWIDMEHSPLSLEQVQQLIQAKEAHVPAFVRIPANDDVWIKRVLDLGADGIIVPQVKTAAEATKAVAAANYPPVGTRSAGIARAHQFGMRFADYVQQANEHTQVLLQVEHVDGVTNIDEITRVVGVDAIIIGPYDLSGSFGKLGQIQDPEVQTAITTVFQTCKRNGMPIGIFALQAAQGEVYLKTGYELLALGIDTHHLWSSAQASLQALTSVHSS